MNATWAQPSKLLFEKSSRLGKDKRILNSKGCMHLEKKISLEITSKKNNNAILFWKNWLDYGKFSTGWVLIKKYFLNKHKPWLSKSEERLSIIRCEEVQEEGALRS